MAKRKNNRGGTHGIFKRTGALVWISGHVSAAAFANARERLLEAYELIHGHMPKRITKPDVIEYLMMGDALAIKVMSAERGRLDRAAAQAWDKGASRALRAGGR